MTNKITTEKAIEILKEGMSYGDTICFSDVDRWYIAESKVIELAIEALEYRKPKPVVKIPYGWECPVCKAFWATYKGNFIDTDFCPNCGQALDWGDKE